MTLRTASGSGLGAFLSFVSAVASLLYVGVGIAVGSLALVSLVVYRRRREGVARIGDKPGPDP